MYQSYQRYHSCKYNVHWLVFLLWLYQLEKCCNSKRMQSWKRCFPGHLHDYILLIRSCNRQLFGGWVDAYEISTENMNVLKCGRTFCRSAAFLVGCQMYIPGQKHIMKPKTNYKKVSGLFEEERLSSNISCLFYDWLNFCNFWQL